MLTHADRARLAHRVLRLRENGITTDQQVTDLARSVNPWADAPPIIGGNGHPLTAIAAHTQWALKPDMPGPTDEEGFVAALFNDRSLKDIYKVWDEAVTENLAENHPDDLAVVEAANAEAAAAAAEGDAERSETGLWTPRNEGLRHGAEEWGMGNALFDLAREYFLDIWLKTGGTIAAADVRAILVDSADYAVNLATHQYLSSVASIGRVATSTSLTGKTVTAGVFDALDISWPTVSGDPSEAIVLYDHNGGADAARRLIGYIDTATGLPVSPNGGDIAVAWDSGSNRIFKL